MPVPQCTGGRLSSSGPKFVHTKFAWVNVRTEIPSSWRPCKWPPSATGSQTDLQQEISTHWRGAKEDFFRLSTIVPWPGMNKITPLWKGEPFSPFKHRGEHLFAVWAGGAVCRGTLWKKERSGARGGDVFHWFLWEKSRLKGNLLVTRIEIVTPEKK